MGGAFHYAAILWRLPEHDVDFTTAIRFFFGLAAAGAILLSEAYDADMKLPIAMMVVMLVGLPGSAALFDAIDASPEIRAAIWGFIILVCGGIAGAHGDKLPGSPSRREHDRRRHPS